MFVPDRKPGTDVHLAFCSCSFTLGNNIKLKHIRQSMTQQCTFTEMHLDLHAWIHTSFYKYGLEDCNHELQREEGSGIAALLKLCFSPENLESLNYVNCVATT